MRGLTLLLFLIPLGLSAQTELWPTAKAEWTYTISDNQFFNGHSHYKIERDTIILGNTCQIYSKKTKVYFSGIPGEDVQESTKNIQFILHLEDSLLQIYSQVRNEFDTVMNFAAEVGDSWTAYNYANCPLSSGDVLTKVISKEMILIEGKNLIKIELQRITSSGSTTEFFHQLIGSESCFVYNLMCTEDANEKQLRCFNFKEGEPNAFSYKPFSEDCYHLSGLGVANAGNQIEVTVINPAFKQEIAFKNLKIDEIEKIEIFDLAGKKMNYSSLTESGDYLILKSNACLNEGTYFFQIQFQNKTISNGKIVVLNN